MNSHTYMWKQPSLPIKGLTWKTQEQMLGSAVPVWSRPIVNKENNMTQAPFGKARPLKHWRKQLNPRDPSGKQRAGVGMPMDVPAGNIALAKQDKDDNNCPCENAKRVNDYILPDNRYKNSEKNAIVPSIFKFLNPETNYTSVACVACSPQANVTKSATTILSKKYYTDSRAYLRARNKRYRQNLSGTEVSDIKYNDAQNNSLLWPSNEQDGVAWKGPQIRSGANCSTCCNKNTDNLFQCSAEFIYKPNNREFSVQGAVDSSSRMEKLKLKTITKSANSMGGRNGRGPFGMEGVSASRYTGRADAPYFLKSKNQICRPQHEHQNHTLCFFTPTGSIGDKFPIIPDISGESYLESVH